MQTRAGSNQQTLFVRNKLHQIKLLNMSRKTLQAAKINFTFKKKFKQKTGAAWHNGGQPYLHLQPAAATFGTFWKGWRWLASERLRPSLRPTLRSASASVQHFRQRQVCQVLQVSMASRGWEMKRKKQVWERNCWTRQHAGEGVAQMGVGASLQNHATTIYHWMHRLYLICNDKTQNKFKLFPVTSFFTSIALYSDVTHPMLICDVCALSPPSLYAELPNGFGFGL